MAKWRGRGVYTDGRKLLLNAAFHAAPRRLCDSYPCPPPLKRGKASSEDTMPAATLPDIAGHPYPRLCRPPDVYFFTDNLETGLYARLQTNAEIPEGALAALQAALDACSQNALDEMRAQVATHRR